MQLCLDLFDSFFYDIFIYVFFLIALFLFPLFFVPCTHTFLTSGVFRVLLQECDEGYTRTSSGLYLGTCERCDCHGHASSCDPESGRCLVSSLIFSVGPLITTL